jgi:hypothetical protein
MMRSNQIVGLALTGALAFGVIGCATTGEDSSSPSVATTEKVDVYTKEEFQVALQEKLFNLSDTLALFAEISSAGADPNVLMQADYHTLVADICDLMDQQVQGIIDMEVPKESKNFHAELVDAIKGYQTVAREMPGAVGDLDANKLMALNEIQVDSNTKLEALTTKVVNGQY